MDVLENVFRILEAPYYSMYNGYLSLVEYSNEHQVNTGEPRN